MINVVCAVIRDDQNRVLACRRSAGKSTAGKWEFPGGKVEGKERAADALKREIAEELGCRIDVGRQLPAITHHYPEFSIRLTPFLCRLVSGTIELHDHSEYRWLALSECGDLDWAEADVPVWQGLEE